MGIPFSELCSLHDVSWPTILLLYAYFLFEYHWKVKLLSIHRINWIPFKLDFQSNWNRFMRCQTSRGLSNGICYMGFFVPSINIRMNIRTKDGGSKILVAFLSWCQFWLNRTRPKNHILQELYASIMRTFQWILLVQISKLRHIINISSQNAHLKYLRLNSSSPTECILLAEQRNWNCLTQISKQFANYLSNSWQILGQK